jgi:hypothetical protein
MATRSRWRARALALKRRQICSVPAAPCAPDGVAAVRHAVVRLAHEQGDCPWRRRRHSHSSRCTSCVTV